MDKTVRLDITIINITRPYCNNNSDNFSISDGASDPNAIC